MFSEPPPEPWHHFLCQVDAAFDDTVGLHCLGGFALLSRYNSPRPTLDIDCVTIRSVAPIERMISIAGLGSVLHTQHGLYIQHVGIATVPEDYELRLEEVYPGLYSNLKLLALEAHDLALSKLERNSAKDREDVKFLVKAAPLDPELLERRYRQEMRPYLFNEERHDLTLRLWLEMIAEQLGPHPPAQPE